MPLQLKPVESARGARWIADAFRLFARRPFGFTMMFAVFLVIAAVTATLLPFIGSLIELMSLPMLSLGFMVASQSVLAGGGVHPAQYIEPLRENPGKRRALLTLCALYGVFALATLLLCGWVSDDAFTRLQTLLAQGGQSEAEIEALLAEPGVLTGGLLFAVLGTALTIPFWHAPALVHWADQGVAQSLFSSTLALWRSKGAFTVYLFGWTLLIGAFGFGSALLLGMLGAGQLAGILALPAGLVFSSVFYVSLIFVFNDTFGASTGAGPGPIPSAPDD